MLTLKRDQAGSIPASPTRFAGLADMDMHSPFKRDEVGSSPTSRTKSQLAKRRHSITDQCPELLPRTMRVQISLPLPMWGCGPTDEGTRLRTLRSEFKSLCCTNLGRRLRRGRSGKAQTLHTVQQWLGHSDIQSTMRHLKPSRSQETRAR